MNEIDHDQFKYTTCSLTEEECECWSCTVCKRARAYEIVVRNQNKLDEIKKYTHFEFAKPLYDQEILVNPDNIIAKITSEGFRVFQEVDIVGKTETGYSPITLYQYFNQLIKLRIYNKLPIPDQCWAKKDFPGVFRFGDTYYMIGPRIRSDEVMHRD